MTETKTVRRCDICGKEMSEWEHGFLKYSFTIKDYMGNGCANGGEDFKDVCDSCCYQIDLLVNQYIDKAKL